MLPPSSAVDYLSAISISPYLEMGAYEALWCKEGTTFKSLAAKFAQHPDSFPSTFVEHDDANEYAAAVHQSLSEAGITEFGVSVSGAGEYPTKLFDAVAPVRLLYYQGWWNLVEIAVCCGRWITQSIKRRYGTDAPFGAFFGRGRVHDRFRAGGRYRPGGT